MTIYSAFGGTLAESMASLLNRVADETKGASIHGAHVDNHRVIVPVHGTMVDACRDISMHGGAAYAAWFVRNARRIS